MFRIDAASTEANYPLWVDLYRSAPGGDLRWIGDDFYLVTELMLYSSAGFALSEPLQSGELIAATTREGSGSLRSMSELSDAITVPEPRGSVGLALGVTLLAGLGRLRFRHRGAPVHRVASASRRSSSG